METTSGCPGYLKSLTNGNSQIKSDMGPRIKIRHCIVMEGGEVFLSL